MTELSTREEMAGRRPARREYAIGDVSECSHPDSKRTYLGHQGTNAFYQCQRCEAVLISTSVNARRQMSEIPSADHEGVRTEDA